MVEIISGEKGKGKTKYLLDKVNNDVKKVDGSVVYIDKNTKICHNVKNGTFVPLDGTKPLTIL